MSTLNVDKVDPSTGTALELGTSGDTINIPSGVTIANSGTATGFGAALTGSTNNTVTTVTAANAITGEAKLLFDPPKLTIGNASEEDTSLVFDGHAQDYYIGLDDTDDDLKIGLGSAVGTTAHMVFDEAGCVTKPLQPAFLTDKDSTQSMSTGGYTYVTYESNREIFDQNADYNTGTYTFTAPVTGKYFLSFSSRNDSIASTKLMNIRIVTSNRNYQMDCGGSSPETSQGTLAVIADMDASDTAYCASTTDGATETWNLLSGSWFSGALIC